MTSAMLLATLRRRWLVVVLVLSLTALVMVHVRDKRGLYWAQVDVVFLIPKSARYPNTIVDSSSSVIAMAGVIATDVNRGIRRPATASAGATLAGQGVVDGYSIRLPNSGGQWATDFERPVLDVQAIGPDREGVRAELTRQVARIDEALRHRQAADHTRKHDMITTSSAPSRAVIYYLRGYPSRALAVTLVLGLWLAVLIAVAVDRLVVLRRGRWLGRRESPVLRRNSART